MSCTSGSTPSPSASTAPGGALPAGTKPDVVFILTDDLSWNFINEQFAPHIAQLQQQGTTFDHYFVADSLCCPSRSTIFTGLFPHVEVLGLELLEAAVGRQVGGDLAQHLTDKTYIVFSSDNGYHLGQHRLNRGKQTAFDTDIRVPLIVSGPGVPKGKTSSAVVQNTDLYPTFVDLAGGKSAPSVEGHSLVPLLHPTTTPVPWRSVALVEHQGANTNPADPDYEGGGSDPTTYEAVRISATSLPGLTGPVEAVYVEYQSAQHELEYYDLAKDPYELDNIAGPLTVGQKAELHRLVTGLTGCHDGATCFRVASPG